jgi:hypothetical protein
MASIVPQPSGELSDRLKSWPPSAESTIVRSIARFAGASLIALALVLPGAVMRAQPAASEHQIKAAFLYNFAKFVQWPVPSGAAGPIAICVLGRDPFGSILEATVQDKNINGRALAVRRLQEPSSACHILFVSESESARLAPVLHSAETAGQLTVGELPSFTESGGMIGFVVKGNKVRFEINLDAANRAHIQISSRLLQLATIVRGKRSGGS